MFLFRCTVWIFLVYLSWGYCLYEYKMLQTDYLQWFDALPNSHRYITKQRWCTAYRLCMKPCLYCSVLYRCSKTRRPSWRGWQGRSPGIPRLVRLDPEHWFWKLPSTVGELSAWFDSRGFLPDGHGSHPSLSSCAYWDISILGWRGSRAGWGEECNPQLYQIIRMLRCQGNHASANTLGQLGELWTYG